jgi:hypothetical protein
MYSTVKCKSRHLRFPNSNNDNNNYDDNNNNNNNSTISAVIIDYYAADLFQTETGNAVSLNI